MRPHRCCWWPAGIRISLHGLPPSLRPSRSRVRRDSPRQPQLGRSSRIQTPPSSLLRQFRDRPRRDAYSLEDIADDAVALLNHLDLQRFHVLEISMGGMIAQSVASLHPEHVVRGPHRALAEARPDTAPTLVVHCDRDFDRPSQRRSGVRRRYPRRPPRHNSGHGPPPRARPPRPAHQRVDASGEHSIYHTPRHYSFEHDMTCCAMRWS